MAAVPLPTPSVPTFRIRDVVRIFPARPEPVRALAGVDLDVPAGEFTAIVGPSGCGKTTLLRLLAGFDRPDSGQIWLDGRLVAGPGVFVRPEHRSVGIVTQEGSLFPHLSVAANIAYGLPGAWQQAWSAARRRVRRDRVEQLLQMVGLAGHGKRLPDELSGGQQQRVALARALAPEPAVMLLDEPFSALDAGLRVGLREEMRELLRRLGTTTVLVTHDLGEALSLADRVAVMRAGRVIQAGTPAEVYAAPADLEAAAFLGETVELPCRLLPADGGVRQVQCALGTLPANDATIYPHQQGDLLVLRPEQIELVEAGGTTAQVIGTRYFGHDGLVQVRLADGQPLQLRLRGADMPTVGSTIQVRVRNPINPIRSPSHG